VDGGHATECVAKLRVGKTAKEDVYKDLVRIRAEFRLDISKTVVYEGRFCRLAVSGGRSNLAAVRGCETRHAFELDVAKPHAMNATIVSQGSVVAGRWRAPRKYY
jgi:hypothetical protein